MLEPSTFGAVGCAVLCATVCEKVCIEKDFVVVLSTVCGDVLPKVLVCGLVGKEKVVYSDDEEEEDEISEVFRVEGVMGVVSPGEVVTAAVVSEEGCQPVTV